MHAVKMFESMPDPKANNEDKALMEKNILIQDALDHF